MTIECLDPVFFIEANVRMAVKCTTPFPVPGHSMPNASRLTWTSAALRARLASYEPQSLWSQCGPESKRGAILQRR
jgi:hypothetical protein